jgi:hypothetical protein
VIVYLPRKLKDLSLISNTIPQKAGRKRVKEKILRSQKGWGKWLKWWRDCLVSVRP